MHILPYLNKAFTFLCILTMLLVLINKMFAFLCSLTMLLVFVANSVL